MVLRKHTVNGGLRGWSDSSLWLLRFCAAVAMACLLCCTDMVLSTLSSPIGHALASRHTFLPTAVVAGAYNLSALQADQAPYEVIRAARATVPTLSNPFVLITDGYGLNDDGRVVVGVRPIQAFAFRGDDTSSASFFETATADAPAAEAVVGREPKRFGDRSGVAATNVTNSSDGRIVFAGAGTSPLWYDSLPSEAIQRVQPVSGGTAYGLAPPASFLAVPAGSGGSSSIAYKTITTNVDTLQQTVLAPSRTFLYIRIVARDLIPTSLVSRLKGHADRSPQWETAEARMWCALPAMASVRVNPLTGGVLTFVPSRGTSVQCVVYMIQCSEIPFTMEYEAILENGGGSLTTLENLQQMTVYAISAGLEFIPLLMWLFFLFRNGIRGRGWIPSRRDILILISLFTSTFTAAASVAWIAALSKREKSAVSVAVSSIRLCSLLVRDCVGFMLMPLIATGYCTIFSSMSNRIRALVLVTLVAYAIFTAIWHVCEYENRNYVIDETTCESIGFGQVLLRVFIRIVSLFLLVRHIHRLTEAMLVTDNPALTMLFFRYKALRLCYFVLAALPIVCYLLRSAIVSWYNRFIVTVGWEMEVAFFNMLLVYNMGAFEPVVQ